LHRFFFGTRRDTDRACVGIVGFQNSDGSVRQRCIHVGAAWPRSMSSSTPLWRAS
jgi:hypothetical protein